MKKVIILIMSVWMTACLADAQEESAVAGFEDVVIEHKAIKGRLDNSAEIGKIATVENQGQVDVIVRQDNLVLYPYGQRQPKVICGKLRVCSIELQEGEVVTDVVSGDNERWNIKVVRMGKADNSKPIVMLKPYYGNGIETNIMITTDRRVYDVHVQSVNEGEFTPRIGFTYPQDDIASQVAGVSPLSQGPSTTVAVNKMNFHYQLKGDRHLSWYPIMVFDDDHKVFIKFSDRVNNHEMPVFFIEGSLGVRELANYRYQPPFLVIDRLFDRGVLILSNGKHEQTVRIIKKNEK
ncbi:MAG: TrbG/VirB9 family P-type conjugative transfer protein [Candidatus Omnitrophica bacterium]|nr:TrbG/VirB9 family P-type conjugative transfer protein [Candidatus Omnitrophota bacterium]